MSLEALIISELRKHHTNSVNAKLDYFCEICSRLGLQKEGLTEITSSIEKLLRDEMSHNKPIN